MSELDQYDYALPAELIAQEPLACRSDARLLVVRRQTGELEHARVRDLPEFLQPADALVLNGARLDGDVLHLPLGAAFVWPVQP